MSLLQKQTVEDLFADLYAGRIDKFISKLDKDIKLVIASNQYNAVIPFVGEWVGHSGVSRFLDIRASTTQSKNLIKSIHICDNIAFVQIYANGACTITGVSFEVEDCHRIDFNEDLLIRNWQIFADLGTLVAAFKPCLESDAIKAVKAHDLAGLKILIDKGLDANTRAQETGLSLLMMASCQGDDEIVTLLLEHGANIFDTDSYTGATALHKACQGGNSETARILLEAGAFVDAVTPTMGHTPIMDALWYKNLAIVKELLKFNPNIETITHYGFTLFDHIEYEEKVQGSQSGKDMMNQIKSLIYTYRDLNSQQIRNQKLLDACSHGDVQLVLTCLDDAATDLEQKYPHVNSFNDGYTPLLVSCRDNHAEIVDLLLTAGAEVDVFDWIFKGYTIHKATYNGRIDILQKLLQSPKMTSVIVNVQGHINGYSPLHDAIWHGFADCAMLLLSDSRVKLGLVGHDGKNEYDLSLEIFGSDHFITKEIFNRLEKMKN